MTALSAGLTSGQCILKGSVLLYRQPAVLNLSSGRVVNCEYLHLCVGRYNHNWPQT